MRGLSAVLAMLVAALLAGCGTMGNRNAPERASATPPATEGTVVISTGAAVSCFQASTFLFIAPIGSAYLDGVTRQLSVDVWSAKSDFADHQGNIHVLNLPAGDYEMYPWLAGAYAARQTPYAEFKVQAGTTIYLGEYYLTESCSTYTVARFRDQEERDVSLVRQKNPAFFSTKFEKHIAKFVGYIVNKQ